ncbi:MULTISPECIES: succinate dehydrogenase, hydrophobic membrane anchor protein [Vibrio]|uniref:Succinate dehydrogenase hydrophobic membrane anchor subunit n=1 Tax=Vibrio proteolyticus NBRC 13287 TaxID=1219065 RepID=U2ZWM8_VIBPR|nr:MULTISPECIES: succinate dehydrogenase, hydrophobic membrane anchor protein [Vibrio]NAW58508.1 succinate dehydrogenase, hydrophobic membrane anchor protein [Vibrio sp. V36_P2S2PM302]NAX22700.1 succinate dehydrogenase, hydrophobic membrane anchor protein [Vibrio sp. V39_P1S14PM300]NAX24143.1 succinate dehydrogenase, hydrophobic membrane anchor protein [Vibrio sp. V38_P2S17PM301]NAX28973.1 succinate dehydrogenase, hydrophobic membrane anchor protein [Vibrio sp. V37_P2S8PM304]GAD65815.1 succina
MVKHVSSFGRNGVHDYLLIRATAIIMTLYTIYLVSFIAFSGDISYVSWTQFFGGTFTKTFTMLALVSILIHAWIGLWQVLTDYIKPTALRAGLQLGVIAVLLGYFFSGLFILWGA